MTAPDAREELREALAEALDDTATGLWMTAQHGAGWGRTVANALLPVVTAWAEQQARAKAGEELRAAAEWAFDRNDGYGSYSNVIHHLEDCADALGGQS